MNIMALHIAAVDIWAPMENTKINNTEKLTGIVYHSFQPMFHQLRDRQPECSNCCAD